MFLVAIFFIDSFGKNEVDLVVINAKIYTVDNPCLICCYSLNDNETMECNKCQKKINTRKKNFLSLKKS